MTIMDSWVSEHTPRISQEKGLGWLEEQTTKYNIVEMPVGAGKSTYGLTYSNWLSGDTGGDSFILTPQKILQAQYETEKLLKPNGLASLYGKANYSCMDLETSCDLGLKFKGKDSCKYCIYKAALDRAVRSNNLVLNYTLALLMFGYTGVFEPRKLMICDEAHNLESQLVDFNLVSINSKRLDMLGMGKKLPVFGIIDSAFNWLDDTYEPILKEKVLRLEDEAEDIVEYTMPKMMKPEERYVLKMAEKLRNHLDVVNTFLNKGLDVIGKDFVLMSDDDTLQFKSIYGKTNFREMLDPMADKFLFMSGTIIDKNEYSKSLGLDPDEVSFLSLDSEFSSSNRPVVYMGGTKVNAKWMQPENDAGRDKYLDNIKEILSLHKNEKGIIHTGNFKIAEWLVERLEDGNHTIYHHNPGSDHKREAIIKAYLLDPKPSIMISPSMTEGVDLKNDLGRFAIIAKLAFPYLGDKWIKKRLELSQEWYAIEVVKAMIQGCGRVVRSKTDLGTCYIVDESWAYFYRKNAHLFPKWWREAYVVID